MRPSQTILTSAKILSLFSVEKEEISVREVSKILEIFPSRAHRLLSSLEACGFLVKNAQHRYRLGEALLELGSLYPFHLPLRKIARPHAEELVKKLRTNVQLAIPSRLQPHSVIVIDRIFNFESFPLIHRLSFNFPLHCTAMGKAILAFLPAAPKRAIFREMKLVRYTRSTITNLQELKAELSQIKKKGFATDRGEFHEGIHCVAAPIFENEQVIAAMSLPDIGEAIYQPQFGEMVQALKEKAAFISRQL